jgi:2,4'-dihydroxyacetophenone dioxygenase
VAVAASLLCATKAVRAFSRGPLAVVASLGSPSRTTSYPDLDQGPITETPIRRLCASSQANLPIEMKAPDTAHAQAQARDRDDYAQFRGEQPKEALAEIFVPHVMRHHDPQGGSGAGIDDELLWVPQTETVSFRPLCLCVSGGYYVNLLRVRGSGLLSRHRHPGPVHGHVLKGRWRYLEHDWEAVEGSYVFEPPGETHTLVVPDGVEEMITLFHVTGSLLYCDPDGKVVGADDVFTKLELAKRHYMQVGLGEDFVQQFVR